MRCAVWLLIAACSSNPQTAPPPATHEAPSREAPSREAAKATAEHRRWLGGDLHMHVSFFPEDHDATTSLADVAASAKQEGLEFVVVTPHIWESEWTDRGQEIRAAWRRFARDARATTGITLVPGAEFTTRRGHFGVSGVDVSALTGRDLLARAHAAGGFVLVNHPFAVPTNIPNVRVSDFDMSYRVWTEGARGFTAIDGAEVWNVPLGFANVISKPGGKSGEDNAWIALDRVIHAEHRPLTAVGGSDDHHGHAQATTWVFAEDASEAAIEAALRAGEVCVGGPEAGSFRAKGAGDWVTIGGTVKADTITLAWTGTARLFVDGLDRGEHAEGFSEPTGGALHTYRIVVGRSRSGFIYANL